MPSSHLHQHRILQPHEQVTTQASMVSQDSVMHQLLQQELRHTLLQDLTPEPKPNNRSMSTDEEQETPLENKHSTTYHERSTISQNKNDSTSSKTSLQNLRTFLHRVLPRVNSSISRSCTQLLEPTSRLMVSTKPEEKPTTLTKTSSTTGQEKTSNFHQLRHNQSPNEHFLQEQKSLRRHSSMLVSPRSIRAPDQMVNLW